MCVWKLWTSFNTESNCLEDILNQDPLTHNEQSPCQKPAPPHFNLLDLPTVWWWGMSVAGFRFKHNANSDTQTVSLTQRCLVKALPFKTSYSAVFFLFYFFLNVLFICKHSLIGHACQWSWLSVNHSFSNNSNWSSGGGTAHFHLPDTSIFLCFEEENETTPESLKDDCIWADIKERPEQLCWLHNMHTPITDTSKSIKKKKNPLVCFLTLFPRGFSSTSQSCCSSYNAWSQKMRRCWKGKGTIFLNAWASTQRSGQKQPQWSTAHKVPNFKTKKHIFS